MIELIQIYKWAIIAGSIAAATLAFLGSQIAARDKSMQTLCIGQGAMLGVLIGIGFSSGHADASEFRVHILPFLLSIIISLFIGYVGIFLEKQEKASKNTYFIGIFALLLATNHLVSALFPSLEAHMAQVFFGDLATSKESDIFITLAFSIVIFIMQWFNWKKTSNLSFTISIFGQSKQNFAKLPLQSMLNEFLGFAFICFSIQFLGFLFTVSCLFLPTVVLSIKNKKGLLKHLINTCMVSALGCSLGFLGSLSANLPTVPTIVITMVIVGFVMPSFYINIVER